MTTTYAVLGIVIQVATTVANDSVTLLQVGAKDTETQATEGTPSHSLGLRGDQDSAYYYYYSHHLTSRSEDIRAGSRFAAPTLHHQAGSFSYSGDPDTESERHDGPKECGDWKMPTASGFETGTYVPNPDVPRLCWNERWAPVAALAGGCDVPLMSSMWVSRGKKCSYTVLEADGVESPWLDVLGHTHGTTPCDICPASCWELGEECPLGGGRNGQFLAGEGTIADKGGIEKAMER
jgi:hypothetical protein